VPGNVLKGLIPNIPLQLTPKFLLALLTAAVSSVVISMLCVDSAAAGTTESLQQLCPSLMIVESDSTLAPMIIGWVIVGLLVLGIVAYIIKKWYLKKNCYRDGGGTGKVFWATICKMVCPVLSDHCPLLSVCLSVCL